MFSYSDRSDYEFEPRHSLALWLFHHSEPKLRADLDAPCSACSETSTTKDEVMPSEPDRMPVPKRRLGGTVPCSSVRASADPEGRGSVINALCSACGGTGIRSYHDLPGSYGVEPCGECARGEQPASVALREAAQLKRNTRLTDTAGLIGEWVAVPKEDFDKLRVALERALGASRLRVRDALAPPDQERMR